MTDFLKPDAEKPLRRIGIVLIDGFALMSYASIVEPIRAANLLSQFPLYELENYSLNGGDARSSSGAIIHTQPLYVIQRSDTNLDRLFVVAGGNPFDAAKAELLNFFRRLGRTDCTIVGVSGGPVILALAGLLHGHQMTVHWEHAARLQEQVQDLQINKTLFVIDRKRITCAGGTAPMDLMNALITKDAGVSFATKVSDWFLHTDIRPPVGQQRAGLIERYNTQNRAVLRAIEAMKTHMANPLSQDEISQYAGISARQLSRLFLQELSKTTMVFYRQLRLEQSVKYLTQTSMSITEVGFATGFSSSSHFSTCFSQIYGVSPREYQRARAVTS